MWKLYENIPERSLPLIFKKKVIENTSLSDLQYALKPG
jgi:hypothetical protein